MIPALIISQMIDKRRLVMIDQFDTDEKTSSKHTQEDMCIYNVNLECNDTHIIKTHTHRLI